MKKIVDLCFLNCMGLIKPENYFTPLSLQGPKLEIFVVEFFTQTKPVWVDDLEFRKKI
jgi:hypothetical protein